MKREFRLPRISAEKANDLRTEYLNIARGDLIFDPDFLKISLEDSEAYPGSGGPPADENALLEVRNSILSAIRNLQHPYQSSLFDLAVGEQLYENFNEMPGQMGDPRVWDFLTLILLPDVASERFTFDTNSINARFAGGHRRHVLQRLWKRWLLLGPDLVLSQKLTEDDYQAIIERRFTLERPFVAKYAAEYILKTPFTMSRRREYARLLMRQLIQASGLVAVSHHDAEHLDALFRYLDGQALKLME